MTIAYFIGFGISTVLYAFVILYIRKEMKADFDNELKKHLANQYVNFCKKEDGWIEKNAKLKEEIHPELKSAIDNGKVIVFNYCNNPLFRIEPISIESKLLEIENTNLKFRCKNLEEYQINASNTLSALLKQNESATKLVQSLREEMFKLENLVNERKRNWWKFW